VRLIDDVEGICEWTEEILSVLERKLKRGECQVGPREYMHVGGLVERFRHFLGLTRRVLWQTTQRVIEGVSVPSDQKLYSIFEGHTEMLIRGKAGKNIEFGHMVGIQQVRGKFVTDFEVFADKPVEYKLIEPALESHRKLFGNYPDAITADKGYWENSEALARINDKVPLVAICKKGKRTEEEDEREHTAEFSCLQRFRAGVEGSISFLKRCFRLLRCMNKGWDQFAATVGAAIFAHNLVTLARPPC
jgi:IS5 family transposase